MFILQALPRACHEAFPIKLFVHVSRGPCIQLPTWCSHWQTKTKTASDAAAGSSGNHEPKLDGAASGAAKGVATEIVGPASPGPVSITQLLELQSGQGLSIDEYLSKWAAQVKAFVATLSSCLS